MKISSTWTLAALSLVFAGGAQAAGHIKPGQWQMDTQMTITGMPITIPPVSTKVCITPQDAENDTPKNFSEDSGCKVSDLKSQPKSVSGDVTCDGRMKGKGTFHAEYPDDKHYSGGFEFNGTVGARQNTQVKQSFTSSWLGASCE